MLVRTDDHFDKVDQALQDASKEKTFAHGLEVAKLIVELFGLENIRAKLFSHERLNKRKIYKFLKKADGHKKKKASYVLSGDKSVNIDFKFFHVKKLTKSNIANLVTLEPNFEDGFIAAKSPYENSNIGIDFVLSNDADKLIIVLSKNYKIRTLELHSKLNNTQKKILRNWVQHFGDKSKAYVHQQLWDSFDIATLNQEFYTKISKFFDDLVKHLEAKKVLEEKHCSQFVSRLIGRIVFCWFLRKKEIIANAPQYFEAKGKSSTDYYNEKLEQLFFKVLNTPIADREVGIDSETPFLNGGLFEEKKSDLVGKKQLTFPDSFFGDFYKFLDHYNFTTDESTTDYQQVAIDPEMLGRIFENLLAEQARKDKGTFYTPREIVDHMCRSSLREYLAEKLIDEPKKEELLSWIFDKKSDLFSSNELPEELESCKEVLTQALNKIKIIDPACGSGAFPIGMLQAMLSIYERLDDCFSSYHIKLKIIKKNLFGVDIEPMAIEIARLRTWLTLVVDTAIKPKERNKGIKELPNLDFKFVCANSLLPLEKHSELFDNYELVEKMQLIRSRYFETVNKQQKTALQAEMTALVQQEYHNLSSQKQKQILTYRPFAVDNITSFFDPEFMFGIKKFDLVIANPPYIKEYIYKHAFDNLRDSSYYMGKMDLWYFFVCVSQNWLVDNGVMTFIAPNNWVTNFGATKLRREVISNMKILSLLDFGSYNIFESSDIQTMIMLFKNNREDRVYSFDYRRLLGNNLNIEHVLQLLEKHKNANAEYLSAKIDRAYLKDKKLSFNNSTIESLLEKISAKANFHFEKEEVANGIHQHHDKINKSRRLMLQQRFSVGTGIFVLSNEEKNSLNLTQDEKHLIKPFYTTKELQRWYGNCKNKEWVIYTDSSFKHKEKMNEYPNLKNHLDQFSKVITSDNKPYGLHRARDERFFQDEKIVVARKCTEPNFIYTDFDAYVSATFYIIKTVRVDQKYLVALLNSKLITFWLKHKGKMQGANYQIDKEPILELPLFVPDTEAKAKITDLVEKIISIIQTECIDSDVEDLKIKALEDEINNQVMMLYELTKEEVQIVESSYKNKNKLQPKVPQEDAS